MIREYIHKIAVQMGVELSKVTIVNGNGIGCRDVHLLHLAAKEHLVSALLFQSELDDLNNGLPCDKLEKKITEALFRLKLFVEP